MGQAVTPCHPRRLLQAAMLACSLVIAVSPAMANSPPAAAASATAGNRIEAVALARGGAGQTVLRIDFQAPPALPAAFSTVSPPRLALDFLGTANGTGALQRAFDDGVVKSAALVQVADRTRVVLNLTRPQSYETRVEGNAVLVIMSDSGTGALATTANPVIERFAEAKPGTGGNAISDLTFRRGPAGEGRVLIDLTGDQAGIDIRRQGKYLVAELQRTDLPTALRRRLDVTDFATPVAAVTSTLDGDTTKIMIEPRGQWEYAAYQADNKFVIEIKPVLEDGNKLARKEGYKGDKLSLNFQNVDVRAVLQVIADFTGLNIVTSENVSGLLTLRLKDVPWDQALDIVMQTKGLDMRKTGNVIMVAPREELNTKEKQQLEATLQISELEPLVTESFQLNYMKAEDFERMLSTNRQQALGAGAGQTATTGGQGSILSKRGVAFIDRRTNTLFVSDTAARMDEVRKILRQLDTAVRQVVIEARIVIAGDAFSRALGVRFGAQTGFTIGNKYAAGQGGSLTTAPVVKTEGDRLVRETRTQTPFELASGLASAGYSDVPQLNVNLPVANAAGQLALTLINLGSGNLINLELSAMESDSRGKVVSSPRVVTADNQSAAIEQGTEIPYVTPGSANQPATVTFKKAVLRLEVLPQITPDNKIIMKVKVAKDSVGKYVQLGGGFEVPSIDTKNVETQISVNNGDTAVIGGIYEEQLSNGEDKVPFLGDLPGLGYLFKTTKRSSEKTELLIFLTPRVIKESVSAVR